MANYYWVGDSGTGTGIFNSTNGNRCWAANTGGLANYYSISSADNAFIDANSGIGIITIGSSALCSTLTLTGYKGTLAFGSTSNVYISQTGGGVFVGASTYTVTGNNNARIILTANTGSSRTISAGTGVTEANSISFIVTQGNNQINLTGTCRNFTTSGTFSGSWTNSLSLTIYGDVTLKPGMSTGGGTLAKVFAATSGTQTITTNGTIIASPLTFSGNATYRLLDNLNAGTAATRPITLNSGTLDLNGFTLTVNASNFVTGTSNTKNITFNGGTLLLTSNNTTTFNNANSTGFTTTAGTGTGTISLTANTGSKTFIGGGSVYNCTINQGGTANLIISGNNTFNNITNTVQPANVFFEAGTTNTFNNFNLLGTAGNLITVSSNTASTHTLSKSSGTVNADYLSISYSNATGGAAWYAGTNSINLGNNIGWNFAAILALLAAERIRGGVKITKNGVLKTSTYFDEVTLGLGNDSSGYQVANTLDEITTLTYNGIPVARRISSNGVLSVSGYFDEVNY